MEKLKIALVFFSGTNVTRQYAEAIRNALAGLGGDPQLVDVTPFAARRDPFPAQGFDAFVFGAPVYADFPPSLVGDWIPTLAGGGKPCAIFVTYGGRTPGHAPYHLYTLLMRAGFRVRLSAEFLGRHTFNLAGWDLMAERPNGADLAVAREFAALALKRFDRGNAETFSLQKPVGYDGAIEARKTAPANAERRWAQPVRVKDCTLCGACEAECPAQAMDMRSGRSDPAKCIECLHCMYVCPEEALRADDRLRAVFPDFLKEWGLTEEILSHKQSRIIAAGWQAAA
jgi:ferredoxin